MLHHLALALRTPGIEKSASAPEQRGDRVPVFGPSGELIGHDYTKHAGNPYVQDMANVPKPPSQPRVPAPGPAVNNSSFGKNIGKGIGTTSSRGGMLSGGSGTGTSSTSGGSSTSKTADDSTIPVIGGLAGGVGGYALGKKVLQPMFEYKERDIANRINLMEQARAGAASAKKNAPMTAAVAGAIILAALTAMQAKKTQRNRMAPQQMMPPAPSPQDYYANSGFHPDNQVTPGQGSSGFYG